MTGLEIIIIILGILFVIISILIVDSKESKQENPNIISLDDFELTKEDEDKVRERVRTFIEQETSILIEESDEKLSHLSNDKIMAINEFSDQVVEKIESNHKDVIFLYDMLQKKQEEIKELTREAEIAKSSYSALIIEGNEKIEALTKELNDLHVKQELEQTLTTKSSTKSTPKAPLKESSKTSTKASSKSSSKATSKSKPSLENVQIDLPDATEETQLSKNEKILELHKKKKSVLEISKALNMGQGEVKLIIDLYGH